MSGPDRAEVVHVDLADGLPDLSAPAPDGLGRFVVLWWRGLPLGHLDLPPGPGPGAEALAARVAETVAPAVEAHLGGEGGLADLDGAEATRAPSGDPDLSVVVCTRSRADQLARCLDSIARSSRPAREVIVVDNAPADGATRAVVDARPGVRYVPEPRPGLSIARNTGVRAARSAIVAFTDDDCEVHRDWTWRVARPFADDETAAVTGLVLPADLSQPAQALFERGFGGFSQGYVAIRFGPDFYASWEGQAVPAWKLGAGANMAVRRSWFSRVGLFDERLGAGATGCSEDSELWFRILARGGVCRYEPAAVVEHHHRGDIASLRRLAHAYVRGHVAALLVEYSRERRRGELRRAFVDMPRHLAKEGAKVALGRGARWGMYRPGLTGYLRGAARIDLAFDRTPPPALTP